MTETGPSQRWCAALIIALEEAGVAAFVTSPGARCAPLLFALDAVGTRQVEIVHDERMAAFLALGMARASGRPVALVSTSGSAAAHWLPAVVEADASGVPLILLSADRPPELLECGAPQAMRQEALFTPYVRWAASPGAPWSEEEGKGRALVADAATFIASLAADAVARAWGLRPGPVHLNLAFREPLEAQGVAAARRPSRQVGGRWQVPATLPLAQEPSFEQPRLQAGAAMLHELRSEAEQVPLGLIVAGPEVDGVDERDAILGLAAWTGWPVVADPLSQLRGYGAGLGAAEGGSDADPEGGSAIRAGADASSVGVVAHADLLLRAAETRSALRPQCVWRFGALPTSKPLLRALAQWDPPGHRVFSGSGRRLDPLRRAHHVPCGAVALLEGWTASSSLVRGVCPERAAWRARWEHLDAAVTSFPAGSASAAAAAPPPPDEARLVAACAAALGERDLFFVASSMPIRDVDAWLPAGSRRIEVVANRGVNGIDGTIASACGYLAMQGEPERKAILYLGDVAALHDIASLRLLRDLERPLRVVVFNNDGGQIFRHLPLARHEELLAPWFTTPHGESIAVLAEGFGVAARATSKIDALEGWLREPVLRPELFELRVDPVASFAARRAYERALVGRLDALVRELPEGAP